MKYFLSGILLTIILGSLPAGQAGVSAQSFIGKINPYPSTAPILLADDTLKILAIMVNFQQDRDGTTFGNGKFGSIYSQNYGTQIIDPLPHDNEYFEDHLTFVQNYFNTVSKGKLFIEFTVLPDTFSVSQAMRNYSPPPNSGDFKPIGDFAIEAWTLADQVNPGFQFSDYDLFTIFHAGVGRDISLPGSIGNERDLPSVYLSDNAFREIYGSNYEGIPVSGGSFNITNSMIIPETESRELQSISGTILFEITINGLICASVGSHLGLPDLFDTETGLSAIGRFGLMDGQGIFAYLGTFPPEPSPWSKIRLGWAEPVTIDIAGGDVSLVTNLAATISDTVILKVPLNSSEYYLIENRVRDANDNGATVTYKVNGNILTKNFPKDTTGFRSFDIDSLSGVVLNVDEFDWAVPGNGIVIWHIDENVIAEKIDDNAINTDKNRRGVDVEEADGVQDIGERFFTIFGDEVIGEGFEEDFWYSSNPSGLFENRFAKDTRPNTLTNTGANSLITIKDFSEIDNRMSFRVEFGDSVIKPLHSININRSGDAKNLSVLLDDFDRLHFYALIDSNLIVTYADSIITEVNNFSQFKMAGIVQHRLYYSSGVNGNLLTLVRTLDGISDSDFVRLINVGEQITSMSMINRIDENSSEMIVGTENGNILYYQISNDPILLDSINIGNSMDVIKIASANNFLVLLVTDQESIIGDKSWLYIDSIGSYEFLNEIPYDLSVTKNNNGENFTIILTGIEKFYGIRGSELLFEFSVMLSDETKTFALADLKQDGANYIVINNGINIEVYNLTGALADNFPFTDPEGIGFVGTPLTADFEGDSRSEIISVTKDGRIFAIDGGTGKVVPGFPISCGGSVSVTPVLYNANGKTNLAVLNDQNVLSAWSISSVEGKLYWSEEFGNPQNTSFIDAALTTNRINEFFPANRAYNYPNPVYEGSTNIRYFVSEDSKINIKIFDLAGDYVAELIDDAQGGMDNETVWNVSDIQSGVYFARIEANSTTGKTEQAVIKIAVVK